MNQIQIETNYKKVVDTAFVGKRTVEYHFKTDGTIMSKAQAKTIKRLIENVMTAKEYQILGLDIFVNKYFASVSLRYFPKFAHNVVYVETFKTLWIGKRGGIRKFTVKTGIGKERNVAKIAEYYMKADV
jgi:hypothetical protein